jgi:hypothetical protein
MSTKTLLKRLALGTAVAVTAGTLSLVTTTAAHADVAAAGGFTLPTTALTYGLLGATDNGDTNPNTQTATILSTTSLVLNTNAAGGYYTVSSGGAITADSNSATQVNASQSATTVAAISGNVDKITIKPTGVAGSTFVVNGYATKGGTLVQSLTVTIAGSSVAGVASPSQSYLSWSGNAIAGPLKADRADGTGGATTTGLPLYLEINLNDAYGVAISSSTGALTVTATTGANVSLGTTGGTNNTAGTYSTAVTNQAPSNLVAYVSEATAGAGWNGTVTVTYNGVVVGTKTGTISGVPAKIVATAAAVGHTNTTVDSAIAYQAYDAAGNLVVVPNGSINLDAASTNSNTVSGIAGKRSNSSTASGLIKVTGGSTAGSSSVILDYTNTLGTVIKSNAITVNVGGAAASVSAKLDKSTYNQGDIATLTISFLDSKGNPAASDSSIYAQPGSSTSGYAWDASLVTPMLSVVGAIGTFADASEHTYGAVGGGDIAPDQNGQVVLKFTVGQSAAVTSGSYTAVVTFPTVSATAATVAYSIGSSGTSLNDVLKGIVSLIASINKQIAALAKLVAPAKKK